MICFEEVEKNVTPMGYVFNDDEDLEKITKNFQLIDVGCFNCGQSSPRKKKSVSRTVTIGECDCCDHHQNIYVNRKDVSNNLSFWAAVQYVSTFCSNKKDDDKCFLCNKYENIGVCYFPQNYEGGSLDSSRGSEAEDENWWEAIKVSLCITCFYCNSFPINYLHSTNYPDAIKGLNIKPGTEKYEIGKAALIKRRGWRTYLLISHSLLANFLLKELIVLICQINTEFFI